MSDIILPTEITEGYFEEFFKKVNEVLAESDAEDRETIYMICDGIGGDFSEVMKCIEYMKMLDVDFYGYVLSEAYSGHSMIWSACNNRNCSKHAIIGVHDVSVSLQEAIFSTRSISDLVKKLSRNLMYMCEIYQSACSENSTVDWYSLLYDTGDAFVHFTRNDLIKMGMITNDESTGV